MFFKGKSAAELPRLLTETLALKSGDTTGAIKIVHKEVSLTLACDFQHWHWPPTLATPLAKPWNWDGRVRTLVKQDKSPCTIPG